MNRQLPTNNHITVCICTYKRPQLLSNLLSKLQEQVIENQFTYSVVVVDNDSNLSAKDTVADWQNKSVIQIDYYSEPEQNIALARNKAVENAKGNYIAFIDDDEFPDDKWLINLLKIQFEYKCSGVLGPVKPHYLENTPRWLIKSKLCERPLLKTGKILHWDDTRAGNVLLSGDIFTDKKYQFDPQFGRTGGEDSEFFETVIKQGYVFVWCDEAIVFEVVPPERFKQSFYLKKNLRIGGLTGEKARNWSGRYKYLVRTIASFSIYTLILPFSIIAGRHIFIKVMTKVIYCTGWLLGFCGFVIVRHHN